MAASLSASVRVELSATQRSANDFDSGGEFSPTVAKTLSFANGTGADQSDLLFVDERTVGDGATDSIDLAGVLADIFGATLTFVEVTAIVIINAPKSGTANTTSLTVGGGSNAYIANALPAIGPKGLICLSDPDAGGLGTVVAGTGDILQVVNSAGASATYQIAILGRSA